MNTNRLLFAAARGARIQRQDAHGVWMDCYVITGHFPGDAPRRIHPEDAHLQYGPISTALREVVFYNDPWIEGYIEAVAYADEHFSSLGVVFVTYEDAQMARLFMAEALADEGM